jgi:hypothetical protein
VSLGRDSVIWNYSRHGYEPTQDNLYMQFSGERMLKVWCNDQTKAMTLGVIIPGDSAEQSLDVDLYTVEPGNAPELYLRPDKDLAVSSYSNATYCRLWLSQVSAGGLSTFDYDSLYLDTATLYIVHRPNWDSLELAPLTILVDRAYTGYGTIDDSLILNSHPTGVAESGDVSLPRAYGLSQNYPNPFNPVTTIQYSLPQRSHVVIDVFDILGRQVRRLVNETRSAGAYEVRWDGTDQGGVPVSTGVYLYRIQAGDFVQSRKMLLLK